MNRAGFVLKFNIIKNYERENTNSYENYHTENGELVTGGFPYV